MFLLIYFLSFSLSAYSLVLESARVAQAAYQDRPVLTHKLIRTHDNKLFANRLAGFHDLKSNTVYIGIRGSTEIQNWISNVHVGNRLLNSLIPDGFEPVYKYLRQATESWFVLAFRDLDKATRSILRDYPNTQIVFTGHSYGGLMANLLAQKAILDHPRQIIKCHTFNTPGVQEVREHTLNLKALDERILQNYFTNHIRITDPIGHVNTQEGNVLFYPAAARFEELTDEHSMEHFLVDLENGMEAIQ